MLKRAIVLVSMLALSACSNFSLNPMDWFSGSEGPTPAPLTPLADGRTVRVLWSTSVGDADRFVFSPVLVGDNVYAAAHDGTVMRIDAASGATRWRVSLEPRLSAGVGSDGSTVVVATQEGEVLALNAADGALRWRARVSSEVLAAPAVGEGLAIVRSVDSRVFAFDVADGKRRWVYQRAPSPLLIRSPAGVTLVSGFALAGFPGGKLVGIAIANGAARWEGSVARPQGATELERVADVVGEPSVLGREVCAAAYQGRVTCFDMRNGNPVWSREMSSVTGVSQDARHAYVSDEQGGVHALDRLTGRSLWKQDKLAYRQLSLPYSTGEAIAVGDLEGYVHFLAQDSGAFVARIATDGGAVRAAPIRLPSGFLVQTRNGGLFALAL
ncbi:MAG: outer membrane protein assembly factor BamB [bacterium]